MKVGIRYSDNDFAPHCVKVFFDLFILPTFIDRGEGHMITHLTSPMIVGLFNTHVCYVDRWMKWYYDRAFYSPLGNDLYERPLSKEYLSITESEVYWDDKIDSYIEDWNGNNDASFIWTDGKRVYIT